MPNPLLITSDTVIKLIIRRGLDGDRQNITLSQGELGLTTDTNRVFVGDGITKGGVRVGNINFGIIDGKNLSDAASTGSISGIVQGDMVYQRKDGSGKIINGLFVYTNKEGWVAVNLQIGSSFSIATGALEFNSQYLTLINTPSNPLNGNFGIGITNPQAKLHVSGTAIIDGDTTVNGNITSSNAPVNSTHVTNKQYVDSKFLPISGGTLTGNVSANTNRIYATNAPITSSELTNKQYVDSVVANATNGGATQNWVQTYFVPLSGNATITGNISAGNNKFFANGIPTGNSELTNKLYVDTRFTNLSSGVNKQYVDSKFLPLSGGTLIGNVNAQSIYTSNLTPIDNSELTSKLYVDTAIANVPAAVSKQYVDSKFLPLSGGTLTGNVNAQSIYTSNLTPINNSELTSKLYVDTAIASVPAAVSKQYVDSKFLPLSGGTLTGNVSANTNRLYANNVPQNNFELANKAYVDNAVLGATNGGATQNWVQTNFVPLSGGGATQNWVQTNFVPLSVIVPLSGTITGLLTANNWVQTNFVPLSGNATITGPLTANINTATPAVHIIQRGTGDALRVDDVLNDNTPFVINANGDVGIGGVADSTGLNKLNVYGTLSAQRAKSSFVPISGDDLINLAFFTQLTTPIKFLFDNTNGVDGAANEFLLQGYTNLATDPNNYRVDITGVIQEPGKDYTINPYNIPYKITFTTPPPAGSKVVILAYVPITRDAANVILNPYSVYANPGASTATGTSVALGANQVLGNKNGTTVAGVTLSANTILGNSGSGLTSLILGTNQAIVNNNGNIQSVTVGTSSSFIGNAGFGLSAISLTTGDNLVLQSDGYNLNLDVSPSLILEPGTGITLTVDQQTGGTIISNTNSLKFVDYTQLRPSGSTKTAVYPTADGTLINMYSLPSTNIAQTNKPAVSFETISDTGYTPSVTLYWTVTSLSQSPVTVFATNSSGKTGSYSPITPNRAIYSQYLDANGSILYVGGDFSKIGSTVRNKFAVIDLKGGAYPSSNRGLGTLGALSSVPGTSTGTYILNTNGFNNTVWAIQQFVYGSKTYLCIGGEFTHPTYGSGLTIIDMSNLNGTNNYYPFFFSERNETVRDLLSAGKYLYVGGSMTSGKQGTGGTSYSMKGLTRIDMSALDSGNAIDTTFTTNVNNSITYGGGRYRIYTLDYYNNVLFAGGRHLVGATKTTRTRQYATAHRTDTSPGTLTDWQPIFDDYVYKVKVDSAPDQLILYTGGRFNYFKVAGAGTPTRKSTLAAFNLSISTQSPPLVTTWDLDVRGGGRYVSDIEMHNSVTPGLSAVYVSGKFRTINNKQVYNLAALSKANSVGQDNVLSEWLPRVNTNFTSNNQLLRIPYTNPLSGVLIADAFTNVNGNIRYNLARIAGFAESPAINALSGVNFEIAGTVLGDGGTMEIDTTLTVSVSDVITSPDIVNTTLFPSLSDLFQGISRGNLCRFFIQRPGATDVYNNNIDSFKNNVLLLGVKVDHDPLIVDTLSGA